MINIKSLRTILIFGFVSTIFISSLAVWALATAHRAQGHRELAAELHSEVLRRVASEVELLFSPVEQIASIQASILALDSPLAWRNALFLRDLESYPQFNAIFFAHADGRMYGARNSPDGAGHELMRVDGLTAGSLNYYAASDEAGSDGYGALVQSASDYDPRIRDWYMRSVAAAGLSWSEPYADFATAELVVTAGVPVYDAEGLLLGVLGSSFKFSELDAFLAAIDLHFEGVVYLMEADGELLSSSNNVAVFQGQGEEVQRVLAVDTENKLIEYSAASVLERLGSQADTGTDAQAEAATDSPEPWDTQDGLLVHMLRLSESVGLDLIAVVAIERSSLFQSLISSNITTLIATLLILTASAGLAVWGSGRLVRAVRRLARAASELAGGNWDTNLDFHSQTEFGELYVALNNMRDQLRTLFEARTKSEAQLRRSLKDRELLLRELHHRTKNNMAVIYSLLELQAGSLADPKAIAALRSAQERIQSILLVHKKLYQSTELSRVKLRSYIADLVEQLIESYSTTENLITFTLEADEVEVDIDTAIPCGLILNEMLANALKHATREGETCKLEVLLRRQADESVLLVVSDDGPGLPADYDPDKSTSLGIVTIRSIAEQQLRGSAKLESGPGLTWTIRFQAQTPEWRR